MDVDQVAQVISHAMAPAFLLGAVSGFVAVLMGRMNGILDRIRLLNAIPADDTARIGLKEDLPRLRRRAKLLNDAILRGVGCALSIIVLIVLAFVSAFLSIRHEPVVAVIFVVALCFLAASLVNLGREVRMALNDHDYFG